MDREWITQNGFEFCIPQGLPEISITKVLLFYGKTDAQKNISIAGSFKFSEAAFVAIGNCPNPQTAVNISSIFINARFISCLGNDLLASVLTCRFSLWIKQLDASFSISDDRVLIEFKSQCFSCPVCKFSLHRFCLISGFRTEVRCLKYSP